MIKIINKFEFSYLAECRLCGFRKQGAFIRNKTPNLFSLEENFLFIRRYSAVTGSLINGLGNKVLSPWFITGFTDAEGCFYIGITKSTKVNTKWEVQPSFKIELHIKDLELLRLIQNFFNVGNIKVFKDKAAYYVNSLKDLRIIINHFEQYSPLSKKHEDFLLFRAAILLMLNKEHLAEEGLLKIVSMKASLNKGLSDKLKLSFPDIVPAIKPSAPVFSIKDAEWLAGFITGEGCFLVDTYKAKTKMGVGVTLRFKVAQHNRDLDILRSFVVYFDCGSVQKSGDSVGEFCVAKFENLTLKIIPFIEEHPILGSKALDFSDFKKVADLMKEKAHLSKTGLEKILALKAQMNRGR